MANVYVYDAVATEQAFYLIAECERWIIDWRKVNKYASCPDWRRSPHADRWSQINAKHNKFTTPAVTDHALECFS